MLRGKEGTPKSYYALAIAQGGDGYDRILVAPDKDASKAFTSLAPREWSAWWRDSFVIDGEPVEGSVRCKLLHLSSDGRSMQLFFPQIWPITGYTHPRGIAQEIYDNVGPFLQNPARDVLGWIDDDTYFELLEYHHQCLAGTALYLMENYAWDLLFTETHASDYANHFFLRLADPISGAEAHIVERCYRGVVRTFQSIDRWVGKLMTKTDKDTLFVVLSDHGGTPDKHRRVSVEEALTQAGLLCHKTDAVTGHQVVDSSQTKAVPLGCCDIFISVKGREPEGIVAPEDYEAVQREIIEAIIEYKDPVTGQHPFALALARRDAEMLNCWGESAGDVVYALHPEFDGAHGFHLPTSQLGIGDQHSVCVMAGAGVKTGIHLKGQVRQVDVAPTICYLLGMEVPKDAEGGVIYEALADPNWHLNEIRRLHAAT
jgi:predicted AlkP superfamily phosphohydrolase/phosphomutase